MVVRPTTHLRLMPEDAAVPAAPELVDSYRRLADVFHEVLAEQSLDALLVRIADALDDLIPHDTLTIYEADEAQRGADAGASPATSTRTRSCATTLRFDEGITGWAASRREPALVNQAHLDPRVRFVPGTPNDPEALISIPLIARAQIKGVLNIYRSARKASSPTTSSSSRSGSPMPRRSRSTTRRSARASSIRRRPTRSPASSITAASTSGC